MHTHDSSRPAASFVSSLLSMLLAFGGAARADETPPSDDQDLVTVTGTRIERAELATNSPIARIDAAAIERSGAVNVEDLIRQMPQTLSAISSGVNLGNPGVATVQLRGLGAERTLVLVDGKRFVPFNSTGIVDVNNIPLPLLESIEIVTGGASAVYGSDAMAGVINFRLKKDFQGLQFGANYARTGESDGATTDLSVLAGHNFAGGRGNATLYVGWTDRDAVSTADRDFSHFALATADGTRGGSPVDTQGTLFCFPTSCYLPGSADAQGFIGFAPNGDLAPTGSRLFNYNLYNYLQVPQERLQSTALLNFEINDKVSAYGRLTAAQTKVDTAIAPSGTFFTRTFDIPLSSPFLSAQSRSVLSDRIINATGAGGMDGLPDPIFDTDGDGVIDPGAIATEQYFGRRTLETGSRIVHNRDTAWQAVFGLQGKLSDSWHWDTSYQFARTRLSRHFINDVSETRLQESILGCPPGSSPGCVPGNFFGDGNLSQQAARFIALNVSDSIHTDQQVLSASLSGSLGERWRVPGASAIGAAIGVEYRKEESRSSPDECLRTPGCSGSYGPILPVSGDYDAKEIFGELLVPLLEDRPFAHRVEVETGARLSDYSNVGSVSAYKLGGSWAPVSPAFRVRAMYQKAVRAPNVFEFASLRQQSLDSASGDPCSGTVTDSALRELCLATGVPAAAYAAGGPGVPGLISGQINVFEGGNPNLKEEDSDTFTAGLVWSPEGALAGLNLQLDWYSIKIDNAITSLSANEVLSACYSQQYNPDRSASSPSCALVHRNPSTGGLVGDRAYGISEANENIAFRKTEGVDLAIDYRFDVADLGRFYVSLLGTQVLRNERKATQELPVRDCAGKYGSICGVPDPELRFNQQTTWSVGDFDLGYRWRYLKGTSYDTPAAAFVPFRTIGARQYVDLMLGWRPKQVRGLSVRVGVNNLLDKDPPLVGEDAGPADRNSGNTYPGTFDVLGRSFFVSATQHF